MFMIEKTTLRYKNTIFELNIISKNKYIAV